MGAECLLTVVPHGVYMHWGYVKRQGPQHQLVCNACNADKVLWQHG